MERTYLSIGDVLSLLKEEFPDVTISKIRFLESQGLLDPERTPSGYRKFYEGDVSRLRWILRQQRENFLPLKVIKDRLEDETDRMLSFVAASKAAGELSGEHGSAHAEHLGAEGAGRVARWPLEDEVGALAGESLDRSAAASSPENRSENSQGLDITDGLEHPRGPNGRESDAPHEQGHTTAGPQEAPQRSFSEPGVSTGKMSQERAEEAPGAGQGTSGTPGPTPPGPTGASARSRAELARSCGLSEAEVQELERYGILRSDGGPGAPRYGEEAMRVARLAAELRRFGLEARHLRTYRTMSDREAGLFAQVLMPQLKQRDPAARTRASETVSELMRLGRELRECLLGAALADLRGGDADQGGAHRG